jgi:hypothetical protein
MEFGKLHGVALVVLGAILLGIQALPTAKSVRVSEARPAKKGPEKQLGL